MFFDLFSSSLLCLVVWIVWKAIKRFIFVSHLDNIPGPPSDSFVKGHFYRVFAHNAADFHKEILANYGQIALIKFFFGGRRIFLTDPKALYHILIKDQHAYQTTPWFVDGFNLVLGPGLLASVGEKHRKQRKMLNPVFSTIHMRDMVPIFYGIVHKLRDVIATKVTAHNGPQEIDILEWIARIALELIGQSCFGHSFDPLTEDALPHTYAVAVKRITPALLKLIIPRIYVLPTLAKMGSRRFQRSIINCMPGKALDDVRKLVDVFNDTCMEILESKKKAIAEEEIDQGKDLMSILLRANMQAEKEDKLTDEELLGQMSTFTFGATDSTSSTLSRLLWLLSNHQDVQDKLRNEICEARQIHGDCPYDVLGSLPYLDAVCKETLRLYPPILPILRTSLTDVVLPLGTPIIGRDGKKISEVPIPKGTDFVISIVACNTNPEIWGPDSHEWKPDRWLGPLPDAVDNAHMPGVYGNLMTFGGGNRACIGFKFTELEFKVVLSLLMESFKVSRSDKQIYWRTQGIASPFVVNDADPRPKLPLIFECV